eukprot:jgi/Tetstr1/453447/TSEL_040428.t1
MAGQLPDGGGACTRTRQGVYAAPPQTPGSSGLLKMGPKLAESVGALLEAPRSQPLRREARGCSLGRLGSWTGSNLGVAEGIPTAQCSTRRRRLAEAEDVQEDPRQQPRSASQVELPGVSLLLGPADAQPSSGLAALEKDAKTASDQGQLGRPAAETEWLPTSQVGQVPPRRASAGAAEPATGGLPKLWRKRGRRASRGRGQAHACPFLRHATWRPGSTLLLRQEAEAAAPPDDPHNHRHERGV